MREELKKIETENRHKQSLQILKTFDEIKPRDTKKNC